MNEFDITLTYTKGNHVLFDNKVYEYQPKKWHPEFSTGYWPTSFNGWKSTKGWSDDSYMFIEGWIDGFDDNMTRFYINSEPNEPTVLECKDKMING